MGPQAATKSLLVIVQVRRRLAFRDAEAPDGVLCAFFSDKAGVLDRFLKRTALGGGEVAVGHWLYL